MSDMTLPKQIGIDRQGLIFDGYRLPFYLAEESVEVAVSDPDFPLCSIRVTLLAESVNIDPSLTVETDGDVQLVSLHD